MFMTGAVRVENSLRLIHFGTIVLLFSMMLVVAYLHLAGCFDWITELVVTRLKRHHLLPTVIFLSGLLSAFFVNDIICLVMVPFVLKVTGRMGIKPIPYLLKSALAEVGIPLGMTFTLRESFELYPTLVAPIRSNPKQDLKQPVDHSSAGSPSNIVAPASGAYAMFRDPFHSKFLTGSASCARPGSSGSLRSTSTIGSCRFASDWSKPSGRSESK
jgi:hypothetical protein